MKGLAKTPQVMLFCLEAKLTCCCLRIDTIHRCPLGGKHQSGGEGVDYDLIAVVVL
jgi:hypothetical protein